MYSRSMRMDLSYMSEVFPIMSAIIQAPSETDLDLLPSEAIINFCFIWISATKLLFTIFPRNYLLRCFSIGGGWLCIV